MLINRRTDRIIMANGRIERYKDQPDRQDQLLAAERESRFYTREKEILEEIQRRLGFVTETVVQKRRVIEDDE